MATHASTATRRKDQQPAVVEAMPVSEQTRAAIVENIQNTAKALPTARESENKNSPEISMAEKQEALQAASETEKGRWSLKNLNIDSATNAVKAALASAGDSVSVIREKSQEFKQGLSELMERGMPGVMEAMRTNKGAIDKGMKAVRVGTVVIMLAAGVSGVAEAGEVNVQESVRNDNKIVQEIDTDPTDTGVDDLDTAMPDLAEEPVEDVDAGSPLTELQEILDEEGSGIKSRFSLLRENESQVSGSSGEVFDIGEVLSENPDLADDIIEVFSQTDGVVGQQGVEATLRNLDEVDVQGGQESTMNDVVETIMDNIDDPESLEAIADSLSDQLGDDSQLVSATRALASQPAETEVEIDADADTSEPADVQQETEDSDIEVNTERHAAEKYPVTTQVYRIENAEDLDYILDSSQVAENPELQERLHEEYEQADHPILVMDNTAQTLDDFVKIESAR